MKYLGFILICCSLTTIYSQNNNDTTELTTKLSELTLNSNEYKLGNALINRDTNNALQLVKLATIDPNYRMDVSNMRHLFKDNRAPLLALALFYYDGNKTIIDMLDTKGADCLAKVTPVDCADPITIAAFAWYCRLFQINNHKPCLPLSLANYFIEKDPALRNGPY